MVYSVSYRLSARWPCTMTSSRSARSTVARRISSVSYCAMLGPMPTRHMEKRERS